MDKAQGIGSVLGVGFALLLVAAVAVSYFRANYAKATIDTLKESNGALTERVGLLEDKDEQNTKKITALERENNILRTLVSAHVEIQDLTTEIRAFRNEMKHSISELKEKVVAGR